MTREIIVHILTSSDRLPLCDVPARAKGEPVMGLPYEWEDTHYAKHEYVEYLSDVKQASCEKCVAEYNLNETYWRGRLKR